ncbi:FMN reductase [Actinocrinis puniceicyclus]|uniref:FMN reductase n=1 Tax=Actinocrinis puniceicyclus TaxID=977794 RepID=A0A8J8BF21_9ACTN|nr:FMN reductase [Actinocrinis puniceicyclus]MBS2965736.1 FMN reductase [Actinocrinis puniceicyclus]
MATAPEDSRPLRLTVVTAGLTVPSSSRLLADRLAEAVRRDLAEGGREVRVGVVELRDLAVEVANNLVTGFPSPRLAAAVREVTAADGLIAVTPVFSASYSGLFKSFFDVIEPEALAGLPVLVAATGGTARHSLVLEHALRPLFAYLHAIAVPTAVYAASEDWGGGADPFARSLHDRIARAAGELAELMGVRPARQGASGTTLGSDSDSSSDSSSASEPGSRSDSGEPAFVPFEQQLAALKMD